jgi:hypothetical protein
MKPFKAHHHDYTGRFREVVSDPLNMLITRVPLAGFVEGNNVFLHNGHCVPLVGPEAYCGSFSQLLVVNRGVHEPLEEFVFQELLKKMPLKPVMLELGAYWGHYSMWLKQARPAATVILVEPDKANLAAGRNNFRRNGYEGEFIQAFVGDAQFGVDTFLRSRGIPKLDILHADIDGSEAVMLKRCDESLRLRGINYLFISTHSQPLHADVLATLQDNGYRIEISSDFENDTTSYDGFVFASSPETRDIFGEARIMGRCEILATGPSELVRYLRDLQGRIEKAAANP